MANIENIKLNDTTYPLRDKTTYQSLTSAQATTLLNNGTYNGSDVDTNTVFTMEDGTFQKFEKELVPPGSYETVSSPLYGGGSYALTTGTTIVRIGQLGYSGGWPGAYVGYSEDGGYTWGISTLDGNDFDTYELRCLCAGKNSEVYGLRVYSNLYHTKFIKSTDGGKTFTSSTVLNTTDAFGFLGYLKSADIIVAIPLSYRLAKNETLYSTDGGQTFQEFNTYNTYGTTVYRIGKFDDDTIIILANDGKVYTTTNWTSWTQIGTFSLGGDQAGNQWGWPQIITRVGDYLVFRGSFNGGKVAYSNNEGVTWALTQSDFPEIEGCGLFDYSEGLYIAVKSGTFYTSTDLLSGWESHSFMSYNGGADYGTEKCSNLVHFNGKTFFGSNDGSALIPMSSYYRYSLTPLSYNKDEVDNSVAGITLNSIAETGDGIKFVSGAKTTGYTVVGSPTITDGVVSSLDRSNYVQIPNVIPSSVSSFDMIVKAIQPSAKECVLFAPHNDAIGSVYLSSSSKFSFWSGGGTNGNTTATPGTYYWYRIKYDGSNWKGYILEDNDYTLATLPDISSWSEQWNNSSVSNLLLNRTINFGCETNTSGDNDWNGSIDLNNTVIYVDEDLWWTPYAVETKPAITLDIATDQANAPTSADEGYIGKLWITSGGAVYICTGVSGSTYTWAQITVS